MESEADSNFSDRMSNYFSSYFSSDLEYWINDFIRNDTETRYREVQFIHDLHEVISEKIV